MLFNGPTTRPSHKMPQPTFLEDEPARVPPATRGGAAGAVASVRRPTLMQMRRPIAIPRAAGVPRARPRGWRTRAGLAVLAVAAVVAAVLGGRWYLGRRSLNWQIREGLALLDRAGSAAEVRAALDMWEAQTRADWEGRTDELTATLYTDYPLADLRVRRLLTCVTGTDYGTRRGDWERWSKSRRRLRAGEQPEVDAREAVRLDEAWTATVGFTEWFTTIIPLDGDIYVASLGARFDDAQDTADGVVRVDGKTGAATLFFTPPADHRGPHDVIGIAACGDGLYAACYNGYVYRLDRDGQVRWSKHVGGPVVGAPLAADANRDGDVDVIVVTRAGKVVALSGKRGTEMWVASVSQPTAGASMLGATLALAGAGRAAGPALPPGRDASPTLLPAAGPELIVTTLGGDVEVLSLRTGKALWRHELAAGTLAGAICHTGFDNPGPPAYIGDRAAGIWALVNPGRDLQIAYLRSLALSAEQTLIAGLRTTVGARGTPPLIVACPTGPYESRRGAVCLLGPDDVRWQLGLDGAVWATPAVADLNGDHRQELAVASIEARPGEWSGPSAQDAVAVAGSLSAQGGVGVPPASSGCVGVLSIVSLTGHLLRRVVVDAPIECSPVVADVDGDQWLEVLVADQSGLLHCYRTDGYGPVEWGLYGGDSHNTRNYTDAYAYGQTLFGRQWDWQPD